jgi:hypothetical protein
MLLPLKRDSNFFYIRSFVYYAQYVFFIASRFWGNMHKKILIFNF